MLWLAGLVVLALLAAFLIPKLGEGDEPIDDRATGEPRRQAAAEQNDAAQDPAPPADTTEDTATGTGDEGAEPATGVAAGSSTYEDPAVGYSISYPNGWEVVPIDTRTDFREADTGRYLRIQYTETPGPDAYAKIEDAIEPDFASRHPDYQRVQLTETTFAGTDNGALWEYTYEGQHAYNLQFVTADGEYGFALNFQTPEDQWEESQDLWESFKASFVLP